MLKKILLILSISYIVESTEYIVSDELSLHSTISFIVLPGDSIILTPPDDSVHYFKIHFDVRRNGTEESRITLRGHPRIIFTSDNTNLSSSFDVYSEYWTFSDCYFEDNYVGIGIVSGRYNEFYGMSLNRSFLVAVYVHRASFNKFVNTRITNAFGIGVRIVDGLGNIFDEGQISHFSRGIDNYNGKENIIQNMTFIGINTYGDSNSYFIWLTEPMIPYNRFGNIIRGNTFIRELGLDRTLLIEVDSPECYIQNNSFIEKNMASGHENQWIRVYNRNITIEDNYFETSGEEIIYLWDTTSYKGARVLGNQMYFLNEKPQNVCIFANSSKIEDNYISDTNNCVNGKLTNML